MKKMKKICFFVLLLILTISCENEKNPIVQANGFEISAQESVTNFVLKPQENADTVLTVKWTMADNGVFSSESNYILEIAKSGTNFAKPISANADNFILNEKKYLLKVLELNELLVSTADFSCGISYDLDIRIKSVFGTRNGNPLIQYSSNVLKIKVTPYSKEIPKIAFVTSSSNISSSVKLLSKDVLNKEYEGYVYLTAGNYKFYQPNACGDFTTPTVYGGPGLAGTLSTTGSDIVIANTGHYLIKADLVANTYSVKEFKTFGVFGGGTRTSGTGNAIPMTDALNNNVWKLTVELITGEKFRFKSNLWTGTAITPNIINVPNAAGVLIPMQYPPFIPPSGTTTISTLGKNAIAGQAEEVSGTLGEISVPGNFVDKTTRKKFDIVLDVSKPRNYTYTITENNN